MNLLETKGRSESSPRVSYQSQPTAKRTPGIRNRRDIRYDGCTTAAEHRDASGCPQSRARAGSDIAIAGRNAVRVNGPGGTASCGWPGRLRFRRAQPSGTTASLFRRRPVERPSRPIPRLTSEYASQIARPPHRRGADAAAASGAGGIRRESPVFASMAETWARTPGTCCRWGCFLARWTRAVRHLTYPRRVNRRRTALFQGRTQDDKPYRRCQLAHAAVHSDDEQREYDCRTTRHRRYDPPRPFLAGGSGSRFVSEPRAADDVRALRIRWPYVGVQRERRLLHSASRPELTPVNMQHTLRKDRSTIIVEYAGASNQSLDIDTVRADHADTVVTPNRITC